MKSWRERALWVGSVWLISWVVGFVLAAVLSLSGIYEMASNPFADAVVSVVSIVGAVLIRLHWDSIRSRMTSSNDWLLDHPAVSVGLYASIGMLFTSLQLGLSIVHLALGAALWGVPGWAITRRDRRLRGDAAT
jgi:DMSO reductase anchor subunit